jgi:CubicO group peptidase (beta-lactamase class C family)
MAKKIGLLGALLIMAACAPSARKPSTAELDNVLRTAVAQRRVPGVVAMVATADAVAYEGAFSMNKDTIFAIASMTKPVTSVAVMQLVEAGKVKLDDPAATYLPQLAKAQVLDGGRLRAPKSQFTVRQLLTHTSGFGYEFMNRQLHDYVAQGKIPSILAGGDGFLKAPLLFDPGARWEYGISVDWLGRLVEKMSGQSLEAYFRQRVFEPLGMEDTYFNVPSSKHFRLASLSQRKEDGGLAEQPRQPAKPVEFFSGGGGLFSTAADYLKFTRALMAGGQLGQQHILTPESVAAMGQNQIGELGLRPFSSLMPQFARDGAALPGGLDKFGLGFALNTQPLEKGRGANTLSWAGIFNTFFWIDREKKVCAVLMTQMSPGLDDGPRTLLEDFDRAVYAWRDAVAP